MPPQDISLAKKYVSKAQNASNLGHAFNIPFNQFKRMRIRKTCALTRVPMTLENSTIDRIDNSKGYLPNNVAAVRQDMNRIKGQMEALIAQTPDVTWYSLKRLVDNTIKHIEEHPDGTRNPRSSRRSGSRTL